MHNAVNKDERALIIAGDFASSFSSCFSLTSTFNSSTHPSIICKCLYSICAHTSSTVTWLWVKAAGHRNSNLSALKDPLCHVVQLYLRIPSDSTTQGHTNNVSRVKEMLNCASTKPVVQAMPAARCLAQTSGAKADALLPFHPQKQESRSLV